MEGHHSMFCHSAAVCGAETSGNKSSSKAGEAKAADGDKSLAELRDSAPQLKKQRRRQADSSDWISSQLTRRFG